jgi:hypothetical protein
MKWPSETESDYVQQAYLGATLMVNTKRNILILFEDYMNAAPLPRAMFGM